jgi:hypothetical protein
MTDEREEEALTGCDTDSEREITPVIGHKESVQV